MGPQLEKDLNTKTHIKHQNGRTTFLEGYWKLWAQFPIKDAINCL